MLLCAKKSRNSGELSAFPVEYMPIKDDIYFSKILELVKFSKGFDFSGYRPALLQRRVLSRARLKKIDGFEAYFSYLETFPSELESLVDALTINVTEFFRDPKVFEDLAARVLPAIVKNKLEEGSKNFRIWSCGSSSGEEAYSLVILLAELLGENFGEFSVEVIGTDIDRSSIKKAGEAVYETAQLKNLSAGDDSLLEKYFRQMPDGRFHFEAKLPCHVEFRFHDIVKEKPLGSVDLIMCRNVLIYFERALQDLVMDKFHSALNKGGFLVLGNVESIGSHLRGRFLEFSREARIYRKI